MSNQDNPPGSSSRESADAPPPNYSNDAQRNVSLSMDQLLQLIDHFRNPPPARGSASQRVSQIVANQVTEEKKKRSRRDSRRRVDFSNAIETYSPTEYDDIQLIDFQTIKSENAGSGNNLQTNDVIKNSPQETRNNVAPMAGIPTLNENSPTTSTPGIFNIQPNATENSQGHSANHTENTAAMGGTLPTSNEDSESTSTSGTFNIKPDHTPVRFADVNKTPENHPDNFEVGQTSENTSESSVIMNINDVTQQISQEAQSGAHQLGQDISPGSQTSETGSINSSRNNSTIENVQNMKKAADSQLRATDNSPQDVHSNFVPLEKPSNQTSSTSSGPHLANQENFFDPQLAENGFNNLSRTNFNAEIVRDNQNTGDSTFISEVTDNSSQIELSQSGNDDGLIADVPTSNELEQTLEIDPNSGVFNGFNKSSSTSSSDMNQDGNASLLINNQSIEAMEQATAGRSDGLPSTPPSLNENSQINSNDCVQVEELNQSSSSEAFIDKETGNSVKNALINFTQQIKKAADAPFSSDKNSDQALGMTGATSTPSSIGHESSQMNQTNDKTIQEMGVNSNDETDNSTQNNVSVVDNSPKVDNRSNQPIQGLTSRVFDDKPELIDLLSNLQNYLKNILETKTEKTQTTSDVSTQTSPSDFSENLDQNDSTAFNYSLKSCQNHLNNLKIFLGLPNDQYGSFSTASFALQSDSDAPVNDELEHDTTSTDFSAADNIPNEEQNRSSNGVSEQHSDSIAAVNEELENDTNPFDFAGANNTQKKNHLNKKLTKVGSQKWMSNFVKIENQFPDAAGNVVTKIANGHEMMKLIEENGGIDKWNHCFLVKDKDGLGLTVPSKETLTMEFIVNQLGHFHKIDIIDVYTQKLKKMTIGTFAKHFTKNGSRKQLFNIISLEVSNIPPLGKLIEPPELVRKLSMVEKLWSSGKMDEFSRPCVQKYVLLSMQGSFTTFHIDFGGSSVYYHVLKGQKIFYLALPTPENIEEFEKMEKRSKNHDWLPNHIPDAISRLVIEEGETLFVPSGVIHAVYTPIDSIVIGGNFLHIGSIKMQNRVYEIELKERQTKYKFPFFEEVNFWVSRDFLVPFLKDANNRGENIGDSIMWKSSIDILPSLESWIKSTKMNRNQTKKIENQEIIEKLGRQIKTQQELQKINAQNFCELLGADFVAALPTANQRKRAGAPAELESPEKRARDGSE